MANAFNIAMHYATICQSYLHIVDKCWRLCFENSKQKTHN